jgi:dUTPase
VLLLGVTTNIPLNWKLRCPPGHFELLMALKQQAEKGITVLGVVIDPDYHGKIGLSLPNGGLCLECRRFLRASLRTTMSCD